MWCFANNKAVQLLKFGKGKKVTWIKTSLYNRNHHDDASRQPDTRHRDRSHPSSLYIMYSVHLHCTHTVCYVTPFAYIKSESVHDCGFGWQKKDERTITINKKLHLWWFFVGWVNLNNIIILFWWLMRKIAACLIWSTTQDADYNLQFLANTFC